MIPNPKLKPSISFTVYGKPQAQGRPRAGKTRSGNVVMYDPTSSKDYKQLVAWTAAEHRPPQLIESACALVCRVYRPIPKSWSKVKRQKAIEGYILPSSKPDLSNYIKGVEDAIEGVILANDSQIVDYWDCKKRYGEAPRIEVEIYELF